MKLHLSERDEWTRTGDTVVSGNAFVDGDYLTEDELADRVAQVESERELSALLSRANGLFSVVHRTEENVFAAVDHIRSWPLYYAVTDDVYISDSAEWVHEEGARRGYDPVAATEYLFACFVSGRDTLSRDVKQVQAGELVKLERGSTPTVDRDRYFVYSPTEDSAGVDADELDELVRASVQRLIKHADGRTILLGLSAGYDSRVIALTLARLGHQNVVAYTTRAASASAQEMTTAESLARDLGFDHLEVVGTDYGPLEGTTQMQLVEDIGYLSEYPHINKVVLRRNLREAGIEPADTVHVLGHQVLGAGTFMPPWVREQETLGKDQLCELIWQLHYNHWETPRDPQWRELFESKMLERIPADLYQSGDLEATPDALVAFEQWYWQERIPKFIACRREYEYLGFDTWYPLLDRSLFSFFQESSHRDRIGKRALKEYASELDGELRGDKSDINGANGPSRPNPTALAWTQMVRLVHALPDDVTEFIRGRYNEYKSKDAYERDPRYGIVSREEFDSISFAKINDGALHRTLLYLHLYDRGFFSLPETTELERALGKSEA